MDNYYSSTNYKSLKAFPLYAGPDRSITHLELGALVAAFNEHFVFYSLFVRYYTDQERRGDCKFFAIKRDSCYDGQNLDCENKLTREDEDKMNEFVRGFLRGLEMRKKLRLKVKR